MQQIEWCPVDRVQALQVFIDDHWRRGHILARDRKLIEWQYRYPGKPDLLSVLIAHNDWTLTGLLGIIRFEFNLNQRRLKAGWLATWYVLPEQRGLGMELLRMAHRDEFEMMGCLGMNETTVRLLRGLRYKIYDLVPRWICPVSVSELEGLLGLNPAMASDTRAAWVQIAQRRESLVEPRGWRVIPWSEESARRWNNSWLKLASSWVSVWLDTEYLEWRYVNHPRFAYTILFAENAASGELDGMAVHRLEGVRDSNYKVLRVVEFLWKKADAGFALAKAIMDSANREHVAFADFYCTSRQIASPLEAAGFREEDPGGAFLPALFQPIDWQYRPLNAALWRRDEGESETSTFPGPAVYFTRACGDQDRPN